MRSHVLLIIIVKEIIKCKEEEELDRRNRYEIKFLPQSWVKAAHKKKNT